MNRRHRLRGGRAFAAVRDRRAGASTRLLRVAVAPNRVGTVRVGFVVTRAAGGAVTRNRIRRRLRALLAAEVDMASGLDLVVSAGSAVATAPHIALRGDVRRALRGATARLARSGSTP